MKNINSKQGSPKMSTGLTFVLATILVVLAGTERSQAQLNPFQATYFQNRYLSNPAMAGYQGGLNLNLGYRQQWSSFPGTPKTQSLTADYAANTKVGLGLNVTSESAGLIRQTRIMGTYAYHLPLDGENQKLSFGISFGVNDTHISNAEVVGEQGDMQVTSYNQLKAYADGDFGVAYTSNHLMLEAAVPNLKTVFFGSDDIRLDVDRPIYMTSVSYKIDVTAGLSEIQLEPKAVLRGIKGYKDVFDAGANLWVKNLGLNFSGIYHSSKSAAFGAGIMMKAFDVNMVYNMETGPIRTYTSGTFEFGLKLKLLRK